MTDHLQIKTRGQGPELVLLHGWAMHSGIWGGLVDALVTEFRVNLVDLPGHGFNSSLPLSRDLNKVAGQILAEVPPAMWVGWSLGGLITLAAALQQPSHVLKAALIAATPSFSKQTEWEYGVDPAQQRAFTEGLESDFEGTLKQFSLQCFGAPWLKESLKRLGKTSAVDDVPSRDTLQAGLHLLYNNNLLMDSGNCKVQAFFVGGTRDRTILPASFEQAASLMPNADASLIRGAGHAPFISHQVLFLDIIRGFLKGGPPA
jgi:pimeloyl-[acyl-carrier protein] methyl ester esterase